MKLPDAGPDEDIAEFLRCELDMTEADSGLRTDDIFNVRTGDPVPPFDRSGARERCDSVGQGKGKT